MMAKRESRTVNPVRAVAISDPASTSSTRTDVSQMLDGLKTLSCNKRKAHCNFQEQTRDDNKTMAISMEQPHSRRNPWWNPADEMEKQNPMTRQNVFSSQARKKVKGLLPDCETMQCPWMFWPVERGCSVDQEEPQMDVDADCKQRLHQKIKECDLAKRAHEEAEWWRKTC